MSLGGLFIETLVPKGLGSVVKLEFLVQEGQIRADGVVKRIEPDRGLALKFTAVSDQDRPRFAKLMVRLRQSF
jgi:predicted transposase YdaD